MDFDNLNFDDILGDFMGQTGLNSESSPKGGSEPQNTDADNTDNIYPDNTYSDNTDTSVYSADTAYNADHVDTAGASEPDVFGDLEPDDERPVPRKRRKTDSDEEPVREKGNRTHTNSSRKKGSGTTGSKTDKISERRAESKSGRTAARENRAAERAAEREAREAERKADHRRRIMEKKADQRMIERQRIAAEEEREKSREFMQQQRIAERQRDVEGRRKSGIGKWVFIAVTIVIVAAFFFTARTIYNSPTSMPNLYAGTISVGNMTDFEVSNELSMNGWDTRVSTPLTVTIPAGVSFTVDPVTAGTILPADQIVEKVMSYGRTGNMFTTMFNFVSCLFKPLDINDASTSLNTAYIQQQIDAAQQTLTQTLGTEPYTIDYDAAELRAVKGAGMLEVESVGLLNSIVAALKAGTPTLDYRIVTQEPQMPDFQSIHSQIAATVVDAKYSDDGKFNVIDETVGCDFNVEEAANIWNNTANGETAVIPLAVTKPAVTGEELRSRLFNDVLGEMTTYFPNSTDERVSNVALCASKVNGTVLYNGDVFSYNATVGERTEEAGFQKAAAYSSGEVVEELGGGACQVSSTIYCATLYACMETVERTCHQFEVAYMDQLGLDATVSWPEPDFKFRNNKEYPIRIDIECDTEARSLHVKIMGTKENDYTVELKTDKYQYVNDLGNWIGWRTLTYRILYDSDGNVVQVPDQYGNMVDYEYTNQIIEATGKPGMDTYMFH